MLNDFVDLSTTTTNTNQRPVSAPISSSTTNTAPDVSNDRVKDSNEVVTLSLRRTKNSGEDKGMLYYNRK